jgi:hypothetical protein
MSEPMGDTSYLHDVRAERARGGSIPRDVVMTWIASNDPVLGEAYAQALQWIEHGGDSPLGK